MRKSNKNLRKRQNRKIKSKKRNNKTIRKSRKSRRKSKRKARKARKLYTKGGLGNNASPGNAPKNRYSDDLISKLIEAGFWNNEENKINNENYKEEIKKYFQYRKDVVENEKKKELLIKFDKNVINKFLNYLNDINESLIKKFLEYPTIIIVAILDGYMVFFVQKMPRENSYLKRYFKYTVDPEIVETVNRFFKDLDIKFNDKISLVILQKFYDLLARMGVNQIDYNNKLEKFKNNFKTIESIQALIDLEEVIKYEFIPFKIENTINAVYKKIKNKELYEFFLNIFLYGVDNKEEKENQLKESLLILHYHDGFSDICVKDKKNIFLLQILFMFQRYYFKNEFYKSKDLQDIKTNLLNLKKHLKNCCGINS